MYFIVLLIFSLVTINIYGMEGTENTDDAEINRLTNPITQTRNAIDKEIQEILTTPKYSYDTIKKKIATAIDAAAYVDLLAPDTYQNPSIYLEPSGDGYHFFIKRKVNVDIQAHGTHGYTPLCFAISADDKPFAKYLLEKGANAKFVLQKTSVSKPIFLARSVKMTQILQQYGADLDAINTGTCGILKEANLLHHAISHARDVGLIRYYLQCFNYKKRILYYTIERETLWHSLFGPFVTNYSEEQFKELAKLLVLYEISIDEINKNNQSARDKLEINIENERNCSNFSKVKKLEQFREIINETIKKDLNKSEELLENWIKKIRFEPTKKTKLEKLLQFHTNDEKNLLMWWYKYVSTAKNRTISSIDRKDTNNHNNPKKLKNMVEKAENIIKLERLRLSHNYTEKLLMRLGEHLSKEKDKLDMKNKIKVILIHGNHNSTPNDNWFPYLKKELEKLPLTVIAEQFPDAYYAYAASWLPFLKKLNADKDTILVGHSSGALAAMRFAEENQLLGSILVGTSHTDLKMEIERLSGYFDTPWNWQAIKKNQQWIVQFASTDDPWIPIEEQRHVSQQLGTEYHEFTNQGHFGGDYYKKEFPELLQIITKKLSL